MFFSCMFVLGIFFLYAYKKTKAWLVVHISLGFERYNYRRWKIYLWNVKDIISSKLQRWDDFLSKVLVSAINIPVVPDGTAHQQHAFLNLENYGAPRQSNSTEICLGLNRRCPFFQPSACRRGIRLGCLSIQRSSCFVAAETDNEGEYSWLSSAIE